MTEPAAWSASAPPTPSVPQVPGCGTALGPERPIIRTRPRTREPSEARRSVDALIGESLRYRRSSHYAELLEFIRGFPTYAPFNGLLVHVQKPGSTYVATASRWHDRWRRRVKIGAQQLVILQPFGPVLFVVDVSDTEPLPDAPVLPLEITDPFAVTARSSPAHVERALARTAANAERDGVRLHDVAFGAQLAGRVRPAAPGTVRLVELDGSRRAASHLQLPVRYELEINAQQRGLTRYGTLCHELAHLYCGHLGTPNKKWWPDRQHVDHRTAEFEAESAAAIAVWKLDPTAAMPPYLAQHLAEDREVPQEMSLDRVMQVAGLITDMAHKSLPARKPA